MAIKTQLSPMGYAMRRYGSFAGKAAGYAAIAVEFDGTNDWIDYGNVSASFADSKQFTFSVWLKFPTWPTTEAGHIINIINGVNSFRFIISTPGPSGQIRFFGRTAAGTTILDRTLSSFPVNSWAHLLVSCDMASAMQVYVNDADASANLSAGTFTDDTIDFTETVFSIGRYTSGVSRLKGYVADLWFNPGAAMDISVEANRRKFIDASGNPVDLGATGQLPTGTQVEVTHNQAVASWHTNVGSVTGGTEVGDITAAPDGPSD